MPSFQRRNSGGDPPNVSEALVQRALGNVAICVELADQEHLLGADASQVRSLT
jgi:hypothetical protein